MIIPLDVDAATHIAHHLRWTWAREVAASLPGGGTPDELNAWAYRMANLPGPTLCVATSDGVPAVMGGIIPNGHIGYTWLAGTDRVGEVAVEFMRGVLRTHRDLVKAGIKRFHAQCLDGPDELFTWLYRMGYAQEGRHPGMGQHGETYVSFGRIP